MRAYFCMLRSCFVACVLLVVPSEVFAADAPVAPSNLRVNAGTATPPSNEKAVYIRQGASGNGSDWANASGDLPTTFIRGTTYYLADGSYSARTLDTSSANSGVTPIIIKKAIGDTGQAGHGTDVGWNYSSMGTGQATIPSFNINSSYWIIDGQKGAGFSVVPLDRNPANYGIKFTSYKVFTVGTNGPGVNVSNITIRHIYAAADVNSAVFAGDGHVLAMSNSNRNASVSNLTIGHSYFYGWGQALNMDFDKEWSDITWEYNIYEELFTSSTYHGNPINVRWAPVSNLVVKYSLFYHTYGSGGLSQVISANRSNISNSKIYGNVFDQAWGGRPVISGNGELNGSKPGIVNSVIYNNTFLNLYLGRWSDGGGLAGSEYSSGNIFQNNLVYNTFAGMGAGVASDYNEYIYTTTSANDRDPNTGNITKPAPIAAPLEANRIFISTNSDPFNSISGKNYTRKANSTSSTPGKNLGVGSEYGYDATGNPRTTWTRGAFEYSGIAQ